MAFNVLRRRQATPALHEQLTIGHEESEIFTCPVCSRPLARGVRRCPGCATRLVAGVPLSRASGFVAGGLVVGLLVGGSSVGAYAAMTATHPGATSTAGQAVTPSALPGSNTGNAGNGSSGNGGSGAAAGNPAISALAGSSLQQAAVVNVKLAENELALRNALEQSDFDPAATADILRSIAASASFGSDLAPNIAGWQPAAGLSFDLAQFYESVRSTAREGLAASITSAPAYKQAARDMLRALEPLTGLDAQARELAGTAKIDLPPLPSTP